MKISYNWLKQYLQTSKSPDELSTILTSIGLEVENITPYQSVKGGLEGLVVGEVITCERHPNADKLSVTQVDIGSGELLNVVCGAPNVQKGQKVIVATIGTTLYAGEESFTIKKSKIRGELSEGMICAEDEIGLGASHDGIMVLDPTVEIGTLASEYFAVENDIVFEIGLTPNRIDAASHYGVARDLAAYLKLHDQAILEKPDVSDFSVDNHDLEIEVIVENTTACPRYSGVTITGVKVDESPSWLKNRLKAIGLNPINNIVDITNYVLHELGQPLHAFDAKHVKGNKVVVKTMPGGTKFVTLDSLERELDAQDLMICNDREGMCIGGVFGGLQSGVSGETVSIFLESAHFNPVSIRKTARRHGLNTDASFRFERGSDPNLTVYALKRAANLIREIAGGTISSNIVDVYPTPLEDTRIELSFEYLNNLIGKTIEKDTVCQIIEDLEMRIVEETPQSLVLDIPPFKADVNRPADVVEEVLRIYGYNNIEMSDKLVSTLTYSTKPDKDKLVNTISDMLSSMGFNEIMSNSLTRVSYYQKQETVALERTVQILNPLSADLGAMRQTLLFGGLEAIAYNVNRRNPDLKLYEFGNCYFLDKKETGNPLDQYSEEYHLGIFVTGQKNEENWLTKPVKSNYFLVKSYAEAVFRRMGIDLAELDSRELQNDLFSSAMAYAQKGKDLLTIGEVSSKTRDWFDLKVPVYYADLNWDKLVELSAKAKVVYKEIAKFPEVRRDLALLLDKEITYEKIEALALKTEKKYLTKVNLFDVYEGEKIGHGKKSYALSFHLLDTEKTLTDNQIETIMKKLAQAFEKEFGAQIRQ